MLDCVKIEMNDKVQKKKIVSSIDLL